MRGARSHPGAAALAGLLVMLGGGCAQTPGPDIDAVDEGLEGLRDIVTPSTGDEVVPPGGPTYRADTPAIGPARRRLLQDQQRERAISALLGRSARGIVRSDRDIRRARAIVPGPRGLDREAATTPRPVDLPALGVTSGRMTLQDAVALAAQGIGYGYRFYDGARRDAPVHVRNATWPLKELVKELRHQTGQPVVIFGESRLIAVLAGDDGGAGGALSIDPDAAPTMPDSRADGCPGCFGRETAPPPSRTPDDDEASTADTSAHERLLHIPEPPDAGGDDGDGGDPEPDGVNRPRAIGDSEDALLNGLDETWRNDPPK